MSLPRPIALCLEDQHAGGTDERFLCCVALAGGLPGLGVGTDGRVRWRLEGALECELWVSEDNCLMIERLTSAGEIVVSRAGRSLSIPVERPVELVQDDTVDVAGRTFIVHVHGPAQAVHEPCWLPPEERESMPSPGMFDAARGAAAAAVMGAVLASAACKSTGAESATSPSALAEPPAPRPETRGTATATASVAASAVSAAPSSSVGPTSSSSAAPSAQPAPTKPRPIEPRPRPPKPVPRHIDKKPGIDF